jgi:hypothetical protein
MTPTRIRIRPYRRVAVRRLDPQLVTTLFDSPQDPECRRQAGQGISEVMARPTWWPFLRADLLAVAAVLNWGLSYGLTKLALAQWRPLTFTGTLQRATSISTTTSWTDVNGAVSPYTAPSTATQEYYRARQ